MNKFILSSLVATSLFQKGFSEYSNCDFCNNCVCECSSCNDFEEPKDAIDCICYTPAYYNLQCAFGIFLDIEFLYWYASETNLAYALKAEGVPLTFPQENISSPPTGLFPKSLKYLKTKWDPGFRLGLGYNSACDGWDFYANWTYYRNKTSNSSSVIFGNINLPYFPEESQFALINPWTTYTSIDVFFPTSNLRSWKKVSAKWKFYVNVIDFEIGRKYMPSECFSLRPYAGVRGAWTKTHFSTFSNMPFTSLDAFDIQSFQEQFDDFFRNKFWGVGVLAGLQPQWNLWRCFAFFANVDGALLWGKFTANKNFKYIFTRNSASQTLRNTSKANFSMMQAIIDLAIGIRLERTWGCDSFKTLLDIGWEQHTWFDHNHRIQQIGFSRTSIGAQGNATIDSFQSFNEVYGNLSFGGFVVRGRIDF